MGYDYAMPGGIGTCSMDLGDGLVVGALAVVNPLGDVRDPDTGEIVAGARGPDGAFIDSANCILHGPKPTLAPFSNTTLVVVATNASLTKEQAIKAAQTGSHHDGQLLRQPACRITPFLHDVLYDQVGNEAVQGLLGTTVGVLRQVFERTKSGRSNGRGQVELDSASRQGQPLGQMNVHLLVRVCFDPNRFAGDQGSGRLRSHVDSVLHRIAILRLILPGLEFD